jgi:hypothetical protein
MTPFVDTAHHADDRSAPAANPFLFKRGIADRPISGKTLEMERHPPGSERVLLAPKLAPKEERGDAFLAFDAIYDDFQAQRAMLRAFAELRGDDGADYLG